MSAKFQVIQGGRDKSSAVAPHADVVEAYGQWSRANKPLGLGYLSFKLGVSQNWLAHEFLELATTAAWEQAYRAGRNSSWRAA